MFTCIIVDDEKMARLLLKNMIASIDPGIVVLAECADLASAVKAIRQHQPNIVFLDIEMPGQSGIEILNFFDDSEINFKVIFTTGYSEYAIQAFRLSALDYLLKPINPQVLKSAVQKAKDNTSIHTDAYRVLYENLALGKDAGEKCILVNLSNATKFVKLKEIVMLHAEGAYTNIYLRSGECLLASKNLKMFEDKLTNANNFFRAHKSYIVNLNFVKECNKSEGILELEGKIKANISNDKFDTFMSKMELLT